MQKRWRTAVIGIVMVSVLLAVPLVGCGGDGPEPKNVITIGNITDLTGPAGPALVDLTMGLHDLVRHINEEDPIPGVELKVIDYDDKMDPSRDIPGYEWLRGRGAEVLIAPVEYSATVLKNRAEQDQVPIFCLTASTTLVEDPGWAFCVNNLARWTTLTALKWIGEQWDYSNGVPKIGCIAHTATGGIECNTSLREYCQANPDSFEWVEGFLVPFGTVSWTGEIAKLKDCDYIGLPLLSATSMATFIKDFRNAGHSGQFFTQEALPAFMGFIADSVGYDRVDGAIAGMSTGWWTDSAPVVKMLKDLVETYHPDEAAKVIHSGNGYVGGGIQQYFILEIIRKAAEDAGAGENLTGKAIYDTACNFRLTMEGFTEWGFTSTKRTCLDYVAIYTVSAQQETLVRASDWLPLVQG